MIKLALILLILFPSSMFGVNLDPIIAGCECKYEQVAASTTNSSGGIAVPNGETWAVYSWQANGADPSAYVALIWDYGGAQEKVFSSTKGDVHLHFDVAVTEYQVTGDGSRKFLIVIFNDNASETPIIGGCMELVKL